MARRAKETAPEDPLITEKKQAILALTDPFCDTRLNAEYKKLTRKLIEEIAREIPSPLLRGKTEIWAAGITHAIGGANFLFDKSTNPYVGASDLAAAFGVSPNTASQKAGKLRDEYPIDFPSTEFATKQMREMSGNMMEMMAQTGLFMNMDGFNVQVGMANGPMLMADEFRMPNRGKSKSKEFVDEDRPAMDTFYNLTVLYEAGDQNELLIKKLEALIVADPDFYDSYDMLAELLEQDENEKADTLRETAFRRALARLPDKKGNWPAFIPWGFLENRHLVRALEGGAIRLWEGGDTDTALDIFRKLLRSNPTDNIGARNYILAIRLGQSLEENEALFALDDGFLDAGKMMRWFEKESAAFPEEFAEWRKQVEMDA